MALPGSGTITMAMIAAEFGGSAPHSLGEYYRGGGLVPNIGPNAAIPTSGQISMSNFYGAMANPLNLSYTAQDISAYRTGKGVATASFTFNSDGTISRAYNPNVSANTGSTTWHSSPTAGVGNSFWIKYTFTSQSDSDLNGPPTNGAPGWAQLSTNRSVSAMSQGVTEDDACGCIVTIQIASDSGGSNILATWTGNECSAQTNYF